MAKRNHKHSVSIQATKEQVFSVLTDYRHYEVYMEDCIHSRVNFRESDIVVAEFISPALMNGVYQLEFVHNPPNSVIYKQIDQFAGASQTGVFGSWEIMDSDNTDEVILTGTMHLKTGWWKKHTDRKKAETILQSRLQSIRDEVMYKYKSGAIEHISPSEKGKVLEIIRRGNNIEVWLLGQQYELRKLS